MAIGRTILGMLTQAHRREHREAISETWAARLPTGWSLYFLIGRPGRATELVGDVLYLDMEEAYENLPLKIHLFMQYCVENEAFDGLLKCDDDVYLDIELLRSVIGRKPAYAGRRCPRTDWWGRSLFDPTWHFGKCTDPVIDRTPYQGAADGYYCDGGVGYFVDRRCAEIVGDPANRGHFERELYEDKAVGDLLREHGIVADFLPERLYETPAKNRWRLFRRNGLLAVHPLSPEAIREAWRRQNASSCLARLGWRSPPRRA